MRSNYQLNEQLVSELKQYLDEQEQKYKQVRSLLDSAKAQMRSAVATDIKSYPKLLFIYNEFFKLKESLDQDLSRKEQFLIPFIRELVYDKEPGHLANAKVVDSFLSVFAAENEKIMALMRSIDEAVSYYKPAGGYVLPILKQAFSTFSQLSGISLELCENENKLFMKIQHSHKQPITNKIRRA